MRRDDPDDPFDEFFSEFERMIDEMMGGAGQVRFETSRSQDERTHVDVYEEEDHLRVVADLPGVEKGDIEIKCDGREVRIRATGERRSYDEQVRLPVRVDETTAEATYNNGVLQIRFDSDHGGRSIDID